MGSAEVSTEFQASLRDEAVCDIRSVYHAGGEVMSFASMIQEILGIPGMNRGLAATKINEAFQLIQDERVWSFQMITGGWLAPGQLGGANSDFLSPGTISVQAFPSQITGDAVATAAWYGANQPIITNYQIRVPYYSLYSIVAIGGNGTIAYATIFSGGSSQAQGTYTYPILDNAGPGAGATVSITVNASGVVTSPPTTLSAGSGYVSPYIAFAEGGTPATFTVTQIAVLTLDRLWMEPNQPPGSGYLAYQAYFPAPAGLKKWLAIRDTINNQPVDWWTYTQVDLSEFDAERTQFAQPEWAVPVGPDTRQGSATFGQMLYELWPGPTSGPWPYTWQCEAMWPLLSLPTDTVPYPLTEELLKFRTYSVLAAWKESQKGDDMERGSGANWQFLTKYYHEEYQSRLKKIALVDNQLCELYFTRMKRYPGNVDSFVSVSGQMGVGF